MPTVVPFCPPTAAVPTSQRVVEPIGHDEFCAVLESGKFEAYVEFNGMQMINLPRAILICNGDSCAAIRQVGTDMAGFFAAAMACVDPAEELATFAERAA